MKDHSSKSRLSSVSRDSMREEGGAPIASGGFGCVFSPPIECKMKQKGWKTTPNMVSKLMSTSDAVGEKLEMEKIAPVLATLPNADKYFLMSGAFMCPPGPLDANDLKNFNSVCRNLPYSSSTVNNNLDRLRIINMPNGGPSVRKQFESMVSKGLITHGSDFIDLNNALIDLLEHAIIPMNRKGLIHLDIKADNVLCDMSKGKPIVRIIDWGLSHIGTDAPTKNNIYEWVGTRPIQFNLPVTVKLFDMSNQSTANKFANMFNEGLDKNLKMVDEVGMSPYSLPAANSISASVIARQTGHVPYLTTTGIPRVFKCAVGDSASTSEYSAILRRIMTASYTKVINRYTKPVKTGKAMFDAGAFYTEVFRKNADIHGFVMIYLDLLSELMRTETSTKCGARSPLTYALQRLINEYCLSATYADKPIPTERLVKELRQLNNLVSGSRPAPAKQAPAKQAPAKQAPAKQAPVKKQHGAPVAISPLGSRKRCPAGTRKLYARNKVAYCVPKTISDKNWKAAMGPSPKRKASIKKASPKKASARKVSARKASPPRSYTLKTKRCRAGYRKDARGRCVKK